MLYAMKTTKSQLRCLKKALPLGDLIAVFMIRQNDASTTSMFLSDASHLARVRVADHHPHLPSPHKAPSAIDKSKGSINDQRRHLGSSTTSPIGVGSIQLHRVTATSTPAKWGFAEAKLSLAVSAKLDFRRCATPLHDGRVMKATR